MAIAEKLKHHSRHILGVLSILAVVYLNFGDKLKLPPIFFRQPQMSFITTNSYRFVDESDGQFFFINGWNSYWLMEESVWASTRPRVSKMLRKGADMGMTVCRTWAFSDGGEDGSHALQIAPGVFDERVFQALDFVIVEARRHRIRLILSLVNNLNAFGGKAQYVKWAQASGVNVTSPDPFFTHPIIKEYYKGYIKSILTRKNSFSGVRYSEEPAIFAWELMNEPRCVSSSSAPALQTWIGEMAEFIKSLDQKHLVTVGLEGFYGPKRTARTDVNPGEWAGLLGSDFIQNSATEHIDFASVHAYPDSWIPSASPDDKAKYLVRWVDSHVSDGEFELKKPVLFTEVGSTSRRKEQGLHNRDLFLKTIYDKIYESAKKRQAGAGALIWQLLVEGMEEYGDDFSLVAWAHASTYKLIVEQSCRLKHLLGKGEVGVKIRDTGLCAGVIY